jgi:quinolinate synthase
MTERVDPSIDLFEEIERLKAERNAVLLAHFYQEADIQDIADFIGDSLQLSRQAAETDAEVIVFCGVHFMAETAKILNPSRTVLLPHLGAGCSLADSCPAEDFAAFKAEHPDHAVISYINCTAETKAQSDIICTSSNAEAVVRSVPAERGIIFAPDRNLGAYLIKKTGRDMVLWQGTCVVHETFSERRILELMAAYPNAEVIAHPECEEHVLRHAAHVGSTSSLLAYPERSSAARFIVATESGILHQMRKRFPEREFIAGPPTDESCSCNECPFMKRITLENTYLALRDMRHEITLSEDLRLAALRPLQLMLEIPPLPPPERAAA